jgi:predicted permease
MHDWRNDVRARLASMHLAAGHESEVIEEIAQHLEMQYAELSPRIGDQAARRQLLAELSESGLAQVAGGRRRLTRHARLAERLESTGGLWRDVVRGARSLLRNPGVTIPGVAALGLGIGLTSAMFSVVYGTLLRPLPFPNSDRFAYVSQFEPSSPAELQDAMTLATFDTYHDKSRSFQLLGAYYLGSVNISGGDHADRVGAARITSEGLDATGVRPLLGRSLVASDGAPNVPPVTLISYATWRDRFAGDSSVIGRAIRVNGRAHTVVGVLPEGYAFPVTTQLWMPIQIDRATMSGEGRTVSVVGLLRRGVSYGAATAELSSLARAMAAERGEKDPVRPVVQTFVQGVIRHQVFTLMYVMLAAVSLVLIVACANVANLLLHRAADRIREIGILSALGASRWSITRRVLVEAMAIAGAACALGVVIAATFVRIFNHGMPADERPFWLDIHLNVPVLAFTVAVTFIAGALAGVLPSLQASRVDVSSVLKDDVFGASALRLGRLSRGVMILEIAVASAMLVAAGFMTKSILRLAKVDPHFRAVGILTAQVTLSGSDTARHAAIAQELERSLPTLPGASTAYLGSGVPGLTWNGGAVEVEGRAYNRRSRRPSVRSLAITPGFFTTFDVPVLQGRAIGTEDRWRSDGVAVVSESFVRRYLPDGNAIGKRIRFVADTVPGRWLTIIGVVPTMYAGMVVGDAFPAEVLTSFWQQPAPQTLSIALPGGEGSGSAIRKLVASLDTDAPVYQMTLLDDAIAEGNWPMRLFGGTFVIFGLSALALAAIGLYAVMAFSVSRRWKELGIRLALGATPGRLVRMICRQASLTIGVGLIVGLAAGSLLTRAAQSVLFQVSPNDPTVYAAIAGVLAVVGVLACVLPASRAVRLNPVTTLRSE